MESSEHSVTVKVPVRTAYEQWTRVESYPRFMDGVHDVRRLDEHRMRWVTTVDGERRDLDVEIVTQVQDQRIAWWSVDEPRRAGSVTFRPDGTARTVIVLTLSWQPSEPAGSPPSAEDSGRAREDLERFKALIEPIVLPDSDRFVRLSTHDASLLA